MGSKEMISLSLMILRTSCEVMEEAGMTLSWGNSWETEWDFGMARTWLKAKKVV